ncbi:hypothetical protein [Gilvibacter sp.]|uniref:hypothetical protein n=1 Tax=Gilvibacter sp. TaxID=2729997 RepID=UPI0025C0C4E0|nr:hypothetical protein [Gilvibacter sp.]NQX76790.1 hypothetical protein [Gilvibacter sp.]
MNRFFKRALYLNICTLFCGLVSAQNFKLEIEVIPNTESDLVQNLIGPSEFSDLLSMNQAAEAAAENLRIGGYLNLKYTTPVKSQDSIFTAKYDLGVRVTQFKIDHSLSGIPIKDLEKLFSEVDSKTIFIDFEDLEASMQVITDYQNSLGNAFAAAQLVDLDFEDPQTMRGTLSIESGTARSLDKVIIKGYEKFPRSYLKYFAGIKTGGVFDRRELLKNYEAIESLPFATSTKAPEVLFRPDSTEVYLYLKKRSSNSFDGILGFANNETDSKIIFNGYLDLELRNNLNFGEEIRLNYKSDGRDQQNFRVATSLPYLFKTPLGVDLELYIFKRDSSFVTVEQKAQVHYQINPRLRALAGYTHFESNNLLEETLTANNIDDYNSDFVLGGLQYQIPQPSLLFPNKTRWELKGQVGNRSASMTSDQVKISFDGYYILDLNDNNSIFLRNTTETLISDNYLTNELMRFGGITSIRGFDENSIDAQFYSVLNTEYRYLVNPGLYVHSIADVGYLENELNQTQEELISFGIGLGFLSKAGVFKINIANGKTGSLPFSFSNTKIHLSLRSNF